MTSLARDIILECYHSTTSLQHLADGSIPFPDGVEHVLQDVVETWQRDALQEAAEAREMRYALLNFAKNVMFADTGDHYRTLAVQPDARQERIEQHYRWLLILLQSDARDSTLNISQHVIRISRALAMLGDPGQRRLYDRSLFGPLASERIDINVSDITDSLLGAPLHGTRARPTVDAEFTVERERGSQPDVDREHSAVDDRSEPTRVAAAPLSLGLVLAAAVVLAAVTLAVKLRVPDDVPARVVMSHVEPSSDRSDRVDGLISERSDIEVEPIAEPSDPFVEFVSKSERLSASAEELETSASNRQSAHALTLIGHEIPSAVPLELATQGGTPPSSGDEDRSR